MGGPNGREESRMGEIPNGHEEPKEKVNPPIFDHNKHVPSTGFGTPVGFSDASNDSDFDGFKRRD